MIRTYHVDPHYLLPLTSADCAGVDYWKDDWRKRSLYQLQIDRFDTLTPELNECTSLEDLTRYCGGTWAGLESRLDYLKGMNFEAIMLSPTVEQSPGTVSRLILKSFTVYFANVLIWPAVSCLSLCKVAELVQNSPIYFIKVCAVAGGYHG